MEDIETTHSITSGDGASNPSSVPEIIVDERYVFPELDVLEDLGSHVIELIKEQLEELPNDEARKSYLDQLIADGVFDPKLIIPDSTDVLSSNDQH